MKAIIKYPGSKWRLVRWIISHFPEHHSYVEPFFGSGAVFFNKPRSNIETVNDLDSDIVNLFDCIRKDPERLAKAVYLTPYSREIYERAYQERPEDPFERALNLYIKLNQGHGFRTNGEKVGWKNDVQGRERAYAARDWCSLPEKIITAADRLRGVQIEHMDALELIVRFNFENVLIYCDPPYVLSTRHGKQYKCEMSDTDHIRLLELLLQHKGSVMISGYDSDLYNQMLAGWYKERQVVYSQAASQKQEVIWMNFQPNQQIRLDIEE